MFYLLCLSLYKFSLYSLFSPLKFSCRSSPIIWSVEFPTVWILLIIVSWCSSACFLVLCVSCKLVVTYRDLVIFRFVFGKTISGILFFFREAHNVWWSLYVYIMLVIVDAQRLDQLDYLWHRKMENFLILLFLFHLLAGIHPLIYYLVTSGTLRQNKCLILHLCLPCFKIMS